MLSFLGGEAVEMSSAVLSVNIELHTDRKPMVLYPRLAQLTLDKIRFSCGSAKSIPKLLAI